MPSTNWRKERAKTRAPRLAKLVVLPATPCHYCGHVRSSHSELTLRARCRFDQCECQMFEPICGCGHILSEHVWGTPPKPWECAFCPCSHFGANMDGTMERREAVEVHASPPPPPGLPKPPEPEKHVIDTPGGKVAWGRRPLDLYDCGSKGCPELATYWTSRTGVLVNGRTTKVKAAYCGPHFRWWADRYIPSQQMTLS